MADIGLNPPKHGNLHSRTGVMTDALASYGALVSYAATGNHADMVTSTTAGDPLTAGVVTNQGDPNNSGLFAVGDEVSVRDLGDAQVQVVAAAYTVGQRIIQSGTAGLGKGYAAETGDLCVVGECLQAITIGTNGGLVSVRLLMQRVKY